MRTRLNQRQGGGILRIREALEKNGNVDKSGKARLEIESDAERDRFCIKLYRRDKIVHGSSRFKGQFEGSVDEIGQILLPEKLRQTARSTIFIITRGFEECLFLYPLNTWEQIEEEMVNMNRFNKEARSFMRNILMWADEESLDSQGRLKIPDNLRTYAGIRDQVLIIGALDHIEIWDTQVFEAYLNAQTSDYETLAERVMGI